MFLPVSSTPGPSTPSARESASAYFGRFFNDEVWDLLVEETNRYANKSRSSQTSPRPRPWHDAIKEEMKVFVGVLMAMGICRSRLLRIENYWSTTRPLHS